MTSSSNCSRPFVTPLLIAFALPSVGACVENADPLLPLREVIPAAELTSSNDTSLGNAVGDDVDSVDGVAFDSSTGNLFVLLGQQGLVEVTPAGDLVDRIDFGERGLARSDYSDVVVAPPGRLALALYGEVMFYDVGNETLAAGFSLDRPAGQIDIANDALAIDPDTQDILVAPEHLDFGSYAADEVPDNNALLIARYTRSGALQQENDVTDAGIRAEGLAVDRTADQLLLVDGSLLHRMTRDGHLIASVPLEGVEDAAGLTFGADADTLIVADRADMELRTFTLER